MVNVNKGSGQINQLDFGEGEDSQLLVATYDKGQTGECPKSAFRSSGFGILLVTSGSLKIKINFIEHLIRHREVLCIIPDQIYEIPLEQLASVICTYFSKHYLFKKGIFFNIADKYNLFGDSDFLKFSLSKKEYGLIHANMFSLQSRLAIPKTTPYFKDIIHNSFLAVLFDIFLINQKQQKIKTTPLSTKIELTNRFLSLVSEQFRTEKRVIYYADCLRLTPRHLSQVVKEVTGRTAGEHIDGFVVREAKILLSSHSMNISEVATHLCFSNPSFFGKYFKKHTGLSPILFKRDTSLAI